MSALGTLANAAIVADDGRIAWIGPTTQAPAADTRINLGGRAVLPGWVDSHTHMLFDGNRAAEFEARMAGQSYAAGGINVTVTATRAATDTRLEQLLHDRINAARAGGTTTLETKTGYGLDVESERRAARIAATGVDDVTFLGAHVTPVGADPDDYVDLVCGDMLDAVAPTSTGLTCSASGERSTSPSPGRCCKPVGLVAWGCGCTAINWVLGPVCGWPASWGRPAWIT